MDDDRLAYHRRIVREAGQALCGLDMGPRLFLYRSIRWIEQAIAGDVSQYDPEVEYAEDHIEGVLFRRAEACRAEIERADLLDTVEALL